MPEIIVIKDKKAVKRGVVLSGIVLVPTALVINLAPMQILMCCSLLKG